MDTAGSERRGPEVAHDFEDDMGESNGESKEMTAFGESGSWGME